jgi:hypothetical protein
MMQRNYIAAVVFAFASTSAHAAGVGADRSARTYFPGCVASLAHKDTWESGRCLGVLEGLTLAGTLNKLFCAPDSTTADQWIQAVVTYIGNRPDRMGEDFRLLAAEAMAITWPCKK